MDQALTRPRFALYLLATVIIATTTTLAYWPALSGGFIFDDAYVVDKNPALAIEEVSLENLKTAAFSFRSGLQNRPLPMLTFALDHYRGNGGAASFKKSNLILHAINGILVFTLSILLLQSQLSRSGEMTGKIFFGALILALTWALHPYLVSTVMYVVQRMEILAATFILLGVIGYVRGRILLVAGSEAGWGWIIAGWTMVLPAIFSKETGLLLPVLTGVTEAFLFRFRCQSARDKRLLVSIYIALAGIGILLYLFYAIPRYSHPEAFAARNFNMSERVLTQPRILWMYLCHILWPHPANYLFFYDNYAVSTGLLRPASTASSLGGLGFLILAAFTMVKKVPLFTAGILLFLASHFLTSNIAPLELAFEHRNYLGTFFVLLAIAGLVIPVLNRISAGANLVAGASIPIGLLAITLPTAATWGDPLNLAMHLKNSNPDSERAIYQLGTVYLDFAGGNINSPFFRFAENEFQLARTAANASPLPEHALLILYSTHDLSIGDDLWDGVVEKMNRGPASLQHKHAALSLLQAYDSGIRLDENRIMEVGLALLQHPKVDDFHYFNFALHALENLGDQDLALSILLRSPRVADLDADWINRLQINLRQRGHDLVANQLARASHSAQEARIR
ncbi:hypothetical protein [Wenzhouxiangella limi]|uniref:Tetratricopeptide repeat protein n=1 Tax=Wenzhouxiangella limi TaxID=2707351 RepID=A0A845UX35_9GAMM|nr:hypothetical protein [Wenzhouxiangella limi]NDY95228.1 hypothetical protein [Wenzhouxiangella limi]